MNLNISDKNQREYIEANMQLEDLLSKVVLEDSEYKQRYDNVESDDTQLEPFQRTYISRSEFESKRVSLQNTIDRINSEENITTEMLNNERRQRAIRERNYLGV